MFRNANQSKIKKAKLNMKECINGNKTINVND